MKAYLITLMVLGSTLVQAQNDQQSFGISFSGFVKTDAFYDSRQTVTLREGHLNLYPQPNSPDFNGKDINGSPTVNMLSIQTRLHGKITGPDALGAKTSGVIEGEFFGHSEADVNGFRLRHSFVKLDWPNSSLLVGQTWHPMFIAEMFPGVVSFNTGAPFQPFSRNPQIRFSYSVNNIKAIVAAVSQRDFTSNGPDGFSSTYLRNSVIPNLHLQVQYSADGNLIGAGLDYKKLTPRLATSKTASSPKFVTDQSVAGFAGIGYVKLQLDPVVIKTEVVIGSNLSDHLMLGGYAVQSVNDSTSAETYTPIQVFSVWGELSTGTTFETGIFAGYTKNLGAEGNINGSYYGRGTTISHVFRVSPRLVWNSGKTRIATELEYTQAGYGTTNNQRKGIVENIVVVSNYRLLLAVYYFF
ncbi:MAG: hypothetical protein J0L62_15905 [Bacteroidetes bacterium]|nr:hypothetical protein [Bacteroidota bacterium]